MSSVYSDLEETKLGYFDVVSGKLRVSDPCYEKAPDCKYVAVLDNVTTGEWRADVIYSFEGSWGRRGAGLICQARNFGPLSHKDSGWEYTSTIGVDSGQAGIYEDKYYKCDGVMDGQDRVHSETICDDDVWYSFNCDRTLSEASAGVIPYGAVSSSGYGDGTYDVFVMRDEKDHEIVAVLIDFLLTEKANEEAEEDREEEEVEDE